MQTEDTLKDRITFSVAELSTESTGCPMYCQQCLGPLCLGWRWVMMVKPGTMSLQPSPSDYVKTDRGYCGMVPKG